MLVAAVVLTLLAVVGVVINDYVVVNNLLKIGQNGTKQTH